jgi:threonylcarbamoyladenosine tRNA methylthiotransferase MtaB
MSSLQPQDLSEPLIGLWQDERLCRHFHLALQSGSRTVLERMRRRYTAEEYRDAVRRLRAAVPDVAITTDVIVGFPGETDEDFAELVRYLESSPLTHLHVFPYSDRPGTDATRFRDKVSGPVVRARGQRVRDIGAALASRFRASQAGTVRRGLTLEDGTLVVTDNFLKTRIPPGLPRNSWTRVVVNSE